jgi:pyruvate ferredoxin oxidoreductase gamma subunit
VFQGLQPEGYVLINSQRDFHALGLADIAQRNAHWCSVPATEIAIRHLGRPLPNAVMLGGFAALSSLITLAAVAHAIRHKFSAKVAEANVAAATEAFEFVRQQTQATADAQTD